MRSWLFVPADSERKLAKGLSTGADALILDLEDAVAATRRPIAREMASQFMASARHAGARSKLYVRINPLDSTDWEADLAGVMAAAPDGIILPKPQSGDDVNRLSIALGHAEAKANLTAGQTRILSIVTEVPISVLKLETYVDASSRQIALSWGAEDLGAVIGSSANRERDGTFTSPYMLVRNLCLITAVAAGVEPIDTVFVNFRDSSGLREEALIAKRDGFTGKIAIHPDQVPVINEVFTPTIDEIAHAQEVAAAFAASPGIGVVGLRGMMLDMPHLKLAERVLTRAKAAGVV
jgi:citrate lyase subunit beta/citryl-CoA lyase